MSGGEKERPTRRRTGGLGTTLVRVTEFLEELRRRRVVRAGVAYVAAGLVVIEGTQAISPALSLPGWVDRTVVILVLLGFPVALVLAWVFERTSEGLRRTPDRPADRGGRSPADAADPATLDPRTVAVLPFGDSGADDAGSSFTAGLHSDLLTRLSRSRALTVISRTSVLPYRETDRGLPEIARTLGAGTIVEGDVRQAAGRVRLNVQLIDARTDAHRWAQTYDRELSTGNLFDIQTELAERIATTLKAELGGDAGGVAERAPTDDLEAYRLQARGRAFLDRRTEAGMREAIGRYREALGRDPGYALAWVGVADALTFLHAYGFETHDDVLPEAHAAARRALDLEPALAEAHASLALVAYARRDGPGAVASLERAIELQPSYGLAYSVLSYNSALLGRAEATLENARRAVELDPLSAESQANLALGRLLTGSPEAALAEARHVCELQPEYSTGPFYKALPLYELGRFEEVVSTLDGIRVEWAAPGAETTVMLARAAGGETSVAREGLARFEEGGQDFAAGLLRLALGETAEAFEAFDRVGRWEDWPTLAVHHLYRRIWEPLIGDPRLAALKSRVLEGWNADAPD